MRSVSRSDQEGVTLVEILVVLVIISIALSIVFPSLGNTYENWTLRSTARQAAALFRLASETARRDGAVVSCYYGEHNLVFFRAGSILKELAIPASMTVRPQKPQGAVFLPSGQILAPEKFTFENGRGRKMTIAFGPMAGQISTREEMR